jgi:predicted porin
MKKSLMAVALLGAFAGVAHAQTAVQIYGTVDAGFIKQSDKTMQIGKRAANTLGFKGTEELGNGLKALFQLEIRYEPDTGTTELPSRPLFQGQSRVGLQGDFGMVRVGRGLTPFQETIGAFEPWHALPTNAGFYTDVEVAGYNSAPLDPAGSSNNRWSNAFWYNTPANLWGGFQLNTAFATKEAISGGQAVLGSGTQYPAGAEASVNPYSLSATYNNGPMSFMAGYERNHVETKVWSLGGNVEVAPNLRVMATYTRQDQGHVLATNPRTRAWVLGATYAMGPGKILAGYGQKSPDGLTKTKQMSLGYEYSLSKRTYVYLDASRKKNPSNQNLYPAASRVNQPTFNFYDIGVNHSF